LSNYVFDLERSAKGLRLNRFLHSLARREKRELFLQDPNMAMKDLTDQEKDMVRRLDWTKGVTNPEMVAHFRGETLEQFLKTRRVPGAR